jgi:hypothetical protein
MSRLAVGPTSKHQLGQRLPKDEIKGQGIAGAVWSYLSIWSCPKLLVPSGDMTHQCELENPPKSMEVYGFRSLGKSSVFMGHGATMANC